MRKIIIAAAAASVAALVAMPAAAQDWYAQVNTGITTGNVHGKLDGVGSGSAKVSPGFLVGASGGVALGNGLRLEGEGLFDQNEIKDSDIRNMDAAAFANVLYDFKVGAIQPYVGAGVGYGSTSFKENNDSVHDQGVAWQIRAGASIPVNDTLTLDVGYRYMQFGKFKDDGFEAQPRIHALTVGGRFKLGAGAK